MKTCDDVNCRCHTAERTSQSWRLGAQKTSTPEQIRERDRERQRARRKRETAARREGGQREA